MRRLTALVPPPRWHATRYFGVFAPASKARPKIVSEAEQRETPEVPELIDDGGAEDARLARDACEELDRLALPFEPPPMPERQRRLPWPDLLARAFATDVLVCDECGGRRKLIAFIPGGKRAREILEQLGIDATGPAPNEGAPSGAAVWGSSPTPARTPPRQVEAFEVGAPAESGEQAFEPPDDPGVDEQYPDSP